MFHRKIGLGWRRKKEGVLEDRLGKRQDAGCSREVEGGCFDSSCFCRQMTAHWPQKCFKCYGKCIGFYEEII